MQQDIIATLTPYEFILAQSEVRQLPSKHYQELEEEFLKLLKNK